MNLVGCTEQLPPALVTTSGLSIKSDVLKLDAAQELKAVNKALGSYLVSSQWLLYMGGYCDAQLSTHINIFCYSIKRLKWLVTTVHSWSIFFYISHPLSVLIHLWCNNQLSVLAYAISWLWRWTYHRYFT